MATHPLVSEAPHPPSRTARRYQFHARSLLIMLLLTALAQTVTTQTATAQTATLLADLRAGVSDESSQPYPAQFGAERLLPMTDPDGYFFFFGDDGTHGRELWRTDGTPGSLRLVADICPGPCSSTDEVLDYRIVRRTDFPGRPLLMIANDGVSQQLWRIDDDGGTAEPLTSFCQESGLTVCQAFITPSDVVLDDGRVLFAVASNEEASDGAWATDGTPEGTSRLWKPSDFGVTGVREVFRADDRIVFSSYSLELGAEWYQTDGSASALPELIEEVCPGGCPRTTGRPRQLADRVLFFWLDPNTEPGVWPWQSWGTGGTPETTESLMPVCGDSCPTSTNSIAVIDGRGYFFDSTHIWTTDGSAAGTRQVATLPQEILFLPSNGVVIGDSLAFLLHGPDDVISLWRLDGADGPSPQWVHLGDVAHGHGAELASNGQRMLVTGGSLDDAPDLWVSDGTPAGTLPLAPDSLLSPGYARSTGSGFFFTATDEAGREVWTSDGTPAGTRRAHDLLGDPAGSNPSSFRSLGDRTIFLTHLDAAGAGSYDIDQDLWVTDGNPDGTGLGTQRLLDGSVHSSPFEGLEDLTAAGDVAIFTLDAADTGREPWVTDGTPQGTQMLGDLNPGSAESQTRHVVRLGDQIVFAAEQGQGQKLWTSDGTPAGTEILLDIDANWRNRFYDCGVCSPPEPRGPIFPRDLTVLDTALGERIVFAAVTDEHGAEPWITDGTAAGTRLLADLVPGPAWSEPSNFVRAGGLVYFLAKGVDTSHVEVWRTDGTATGTRKAADLESVPSPGSIHRLDERFRAAGFFDGTDRLALAYQEQNLSPRLWILDPQTSSRVEIDAPGPFAELTAHRSTLYFASGDAEEGTELWAVGPDTTAERVALRNGSRGSGVRQITSYHGGLFFAADDGLTGHELQHLSTSVVGTPVGPAQLVVNLSPGNAGEDGPLAAASSPDHLAVTNFADGQRLVFSADDGVHGREPWTVGLVAPPTPECIPNATTACIGDRFRIRAFLKQNPSAPEVSARVATVADGAISDTAFFTFFGPSNLELAVKVIDGTEINDAHWLFYGALSDVAYRVVAEDLATGIGRVFTNPAGEFCGQADVGAFPEAMGPTGGPAPGASSGVSAGAAPKLSAGATTSSKTSLCTDDPSILCLHDRFEVTVDWRVERDGNVDTGIGTAISYSEESGLFWFFGPGNTELVVKLLDGRPINDRWWFFYGALSDVEYEIRVVDRQTGEETSYFNEPGNLCGAADVDALGSE